MVPKVSIVLLERFHCIGICCPWVQSIIIISFSSTGAMTVSYHWEIRQGIDLVVCLCTFQITCKIYQYLLLAYKTYVWQTCIYWTGNLDLPIAFQYRFWAQPPNLILANFSNNTIENVLLILTSNESRCEQRGSTVSAVGSRSVDLHVGIEGEVDGREGDVS